MSFARPDLLWWLFALAVIPLLHLARRRARRVVVPHLFIWDRVLDREGKARLDRLRDLLGLLLNLLVGAALLVAWAGPRVATGERERGRMDVVIDVSAAMAARAHDGVARSAAARRAVEERLEGWLDAHDVGVLAAGDGLVRLVAPTSDADAVLAALERLPPPAGRLDAAVVASWLASGAADPVVVFVTGAAGDGAVEVAAGLPEDRVLVVGDDRANAGLTALEADASAGELSFETRAYGDDFAGRVRLLDEDGEELASVAQTVVAGGAARASLPLPALAEGGWLTLRLDGGAEDALAADDAAELWLAPRPRARVLVAAREVAPRLKAALAALDELVDPAAAGVVAPDAWRGAARGHDLVILQGVEEHAPLPPGAYLLIDSWAPGLPLLRRGTSDFVRDLRAPEDGAILRGLALGDLSIREADVVEAEDGAETVLEGTSGSLITTGERDGVRFVHLAFSPFEPNATLTLLPAWPLLVKDAIVRLAPPASTPVPAVAAAGEPLVLGVPGGAGGPDRRPRARRLAPDAALDFAPLASAGTPALWFAPAEPGRHEIRIGDVAGRIAVHDLGPERSDVLPRLQPRAVSVPAPAVREGWRDLTLWLIALALAVLLLEWALFNVGWIG